MLGEFIQTYNIEENFVDKDNPCMGILAAVEFNIRSTKNRLAFYTQFQLVFLRDIIPPIKHITYWRLINQMKQLQINYDNNCKHIIRID